MSTVEQTRPIVPADLASPAPDDGVGPDLTLVSVVIPCLNEAENIERCVKAALEVLSRNALDGEVLVVDNGSEDASAALATAAGARVVNEPRRGYGSAYLAGFAAARGRYIVMADADLTYDFNEIPRFVAELDGGAELVMGDRMDNIQPGAMTWLHRYVGNPILTGLLNLFFDTGVKDAHCGMRALRRDVLPRLDLRTTGMEFASEMVIRAAKADLRIAEFPI
ncbi:MAG: glycosyltransferase family 2 protein, partial [Solirubrobacteraceae bacterium]